jgi:hypothetical protein
VISIHVAVVVADQAHSRERFTDRLPVPPDGPKVAGAPWIVAWQRARLVGAVTSVVVELPHAELTNARPRTSANGRAGYVMRLTEGPSMHNIRQPVCVGAVLLQSIYAL